MEKHKCVAQPYGSNVVTTHAAISVPVYQQVERYGEWFQELIQSKKIEKQVAEWLRTYDSQGSQTGLVGGDVLVTLYDGEHATLTLRYLLPITGENSTSDNSELNELVSVPADCFLAVLGNGQVRFQRFEIDHLVVENTLSREATLRAVESVDARGGDTFFVRGNKDIIDACECPLGVVLVQLAVHQDEDAVIWHFDKDTLQATRATAAKPHATRQQVAMRALKRLSFPGYTEVLKDVANGSSFYFIRWDATRDWILADQNNREKILANALKDRDSQVRVAAMTLMNKLGIG